LGGLHDINLFSHISGGGKSKIKEFAILVSPEASLFSVQIAIFFLEGREKVAMRLNSGLALARL
jgi:hypothetical protein